MHHTLYCLAWLVGSIAIAFGTLLPINKLAQGAYKGYSPRQKKRY
jgi:hypothetical protein